jgi:hypothetical protein
VTSLVSNVAGPSEGGSGSFANPGSGSSPGSGNCGGAGQPSCNVLIDESGTPSSVASDAITSQLTEVDSLLAGASASIQETDFGIPMISDFFNWETWIPNYSCGGDVVFPFPYITSITIEDSKLSVVRNILGWFIGILTVVYCFSLMADVYKGL